MTDIVTKLRERTDYSAMLLCDPPRPAPDRLCHEAAGEIERLRSALERIDKMLRLRFQRSAPIEEALMQIGMGQRDLPSREECREWAVKLGVPDDVREVLANTEPQG